MTTFSEKRAHLGVGYGTFARAHLGYVADLQPSTQVSQPPRNPTPKITLPAPIVLADHDGGFGAGFFQGLRERVRDNEAIAENVFVQLAEQVTELSRSPEIRTWTSAVLSQAGRRGEPLKTETDIARVILRTAQRERSSFPLFDTVRLGASLVSLGLSTVLVAHGELAFTRALILVKVDGNWSYCDPQGQFELGDHRPFLIERFFHVQHSAATDELEAMRQEIQQILNALRKTMLARPSTTAAVVVAPSNDLLLRSLLTGIGVGAGVVAILWFLSSLPKPEPAE